MVSRRTISLRKTIAPAIVLFAFGGATFMLLAQEFLPASLSQWRSEHMGATFTRARFGAGVDGSHQNSFGHAYVDNVQPLPIHGPPIPPPLQLDYDSDSQSQKQPYEFPADILPVKTDVDKQAYSWIEHNQIAMRELFSCMGAGTCKENQTNVVLLASYRFEMLLEGHIGGEEMWARSTVLALKNLGYTYLYTYSPDLFGAVAFYRLFPDLVKMVIMEGEESEVCFGNERCVLGYKNPYGIPAWKIFAFSFWTGEGHPLGRKWTLSPEPYALEHSWYSNNTYLGYSVEPGCKTVPYVPASERPKQMYILAKHLKYFVAEENAWPLSFYDEVSTETGARFLLGADGYEPAGFPKSIENVGLMPNSEFYRVLANSSLLIGIGLPWTSPTPYDALCLGVPFINPILGWDKADPTNRDKWQTQQGLLKMYDPPYVYNVFRDDQEGFKKAIKDALSTPIERQVWSRSVIRGLDCARSFILERMKMGAIEERLGSILSHDWRSEGEAELKHRMETGEGEWFTV
ncbi:unnamed protein product [Mycena citricolor]|uniref:Glycosyltransferase family 18 catalytic domain-containing protein n=1 Tax=Mycena citricolor TaxID=2018698 RepID=A0AAD2HG92_9AGAR|nr:unnamed protein product [Mycena citricolor]